MSKNILYYSIGKDIFLIRLNEVENIMGDVINMIAQQEQLPVRQIRIKFEGKVLQIDDNIPHNTSKQNPLTIEYTPDDPITQCKINPVISFDFSPKAFQKAKKEYNQYQIESDKRFLHLLQKSVRDFMERLHPPLSNNSPLFALYVNGNFITYGNDKKSLYRNEGMIIPGHPMVFEVGKKYKIPDKLPEVRNVRNNLRCFQGSGYFAGKIIGLNKHPHPPYPYVTADVKEQDGTWTELVFVRDWGAPFCEIQRTNLPRSAIFKGHRIINEKRRERFEITLRFAGKEYNIFVTTTELPVNLLGNDIGHCYEEITNKKEGKIYFYKLQSYEWKHVDEENEQHIEDVITDILDS